MTKYFALCYLALMQGKNEVAKGLIVLANIAAGSLVFGQFLDDKINWLGFTIGFVGALTLYASALILFNK